MIADGLPILYSFRRCPYAMRARMAIAISEQKVKLREIVLRDKPREMLDISPKGTVPVLHLNDGRVIEESLAIMQWALAQNDPARWLGPVEHREEAMALIDAAETDFKGHLDRYKYPSRYENVDPLEQRALALLFVKRLSEKLGGKNFLFDDQPGLADIAIFPFIRQFANTDRDWFDAIAGITPARAWLDRCLSLPIFACVMDKYPPWQTGDTEPVFPQV